MRGLTRGQPAIGDRRGTAWRSQASPPYEGTPVAGRSPRHPAFRHVDISCLTDRPASCGVSLPPSSPLLSSHSLPLTGTDAERTPTLRYSLRYAPTAHPKSRATAPLHVFASMTDTSRRPIQTRHMGNCAAENQHRAFPRLFRLRRVSSNGRLTANHPFPLVFGRRSEAC